MILAWMIYTSVATLMMGLAARSLEQAAWQRGWPVRGVWVLALLGSLLLSALALITPSGSGAGRQDNAPAAGASGAAPGDALVPWFGWTEPLSASTAWVWNAEIFTWLLTFWIILSGTLALCIFLSYRILLHRRRGWVMQEVDGRAVWVSPGTGPAVIGLRRSHIVLPAWVLEAGPAERGLILTHEEEHVRAGDPRLLMGALLLAVVLPWNLALWWMWRRLRQAVEVDCDLRVLSRGADPRAYSRLLLEVTDRGGAHHLAVLALSESPSFLERRIRLMLSSRAHHWIRIAGPILLAFGLVAAACRMEQPAPPAAGRVTLWISPTGSYHLEEPTSEATPLAQLDEALRTALSRTRESTVLNVRAYEGAGGYEYIMARRAACEAGVRRIDFAGGLPLGSRDAAAATAGMQGEDEIQPPCSESNQQPDTAAVREVPVQRVAP
ncbi:hypothetical protein BH23GEM8_BH23GEM8_10880 [soil metagenome]